MPRIFIELKRQKANGLPRFEEVDEFVFKERTHALDADGEARYTGNYFTLHETEGVEAHFSGDTRGLVVMAQLCGIKPERIERSNGLAIEPAMVKFQKGRSRFIYELATGEKFKK